MQSAVYGVPVLVVLRRTGVFVADTRGFLAAGVLLAAVFLAGVFNAILIVFFGIAFFGAVFFVSVGMFIDPGVIVDYWPLILLLCAGTII